MKRYYVNERILARGKTVSMGINLHQENRHVTLFVAAEELFHGRIPREYAALRGLSGSARIDLAFAAGADALSQAPHAPPLDSVTATYLHALPGQAFALLYLWPALIC